MTKRRTDKAPDNGVRIDATPAPTVTIVSAYLDHIKRVQQHIEAGNLHHPAAIEFREAVNLTQQIAGDFQLTDIAAAIQARADGCFDNLNQALEKPLESVFVSYYDLRKITKMLIWKILESTSAVTEPGMLDKLDVSTDHAAITNAAVYVERAAKDILGMLDFNLVITDVPNDTNPT